MWSMSQIKLGVKRALLTYFHVVRSPRDGIELIASNMVCQCVGLPRKLSYSSLG